jgi:hypothetical protein
MHPMNITVVIEQQLVIGLISTWDAQNLIFIGSDLSPFGRINLLLNFGTVEKK